MQQENEGCYEFGPFRLDPAQQQLSAGGKPVALTPKAFATLLLLVRNSGRLVSKEELLKAVWPDVIVEEATIAQNIFRLRKVPGDAADGAPLHRDPAEARLSIQGTGAQRGHRARGTGASLESPRAAARAVAGTRGYAPVRLVADSP
ncbi:MAG TPA: winged helix-turn-helix domain-containing protein [Steroidobacteraceae bacterium]|nr:winged helix-turn-helix domain-containing protein [Steroidobacteraceae bacterium]